MAFLYAQHDTMQASSHLAYTLIQLKALSRDKRQGINASQIMIHFAPHMTSVGHGRVILFT